MVLSIQGCVWAATMRHTPSFASGDNSGTGSVQDLCNIHKATMDARRNPVGVLYDELPVVDTGSPGNTNDANIANTQNDWDYLAACGAMLQAEGPNEPNNQPFYYEGNYCSQGGSVLPVRAVSAGALQ